ncbi:MAG: MBL fold metallo-hydrolase, partial [Chitinophagaceae bacterium]
MSLIPAFKKDERLIEEMDSFLPDTRQVHLWWLGQSGYLIQWQGCRLLIDPYLSDALTVKYAHTDKPHVRMSERVVDPERLRNIDVVTSSHNHTDHLDADTLLPVLRNNPRCQLVIPEANRSFVAERLGCEASFPVGLNDGQKITLGPFTFYGMPAKHNEITRDARGNCAYMGYVMRMGNHTIYHSGDTLWFEELVTLLRPFSLDLALLPINGNDP